MKVLKKSKFVGERMIKTAVAVFITAHLCYLLELPVAFAVIIAIVTIEPTASDSIKKGLIRFPAALIGAGLAMTFTYFFGQTPLTYTLSGFLTLFLCHKLKLQDGALIATITAVAMIQLTQDHFLLSFLERAGTTTLGLLVSTFVNFFILPAKFSGVISKRNEQLFEKTANLLQMRVEELIVEQKGHSKQTEKAYRHITGEIAKSFRLCDYQREEWKYHRHSRKELREFLYEVKKLEYLQQIHYHIGHLISVSIKDKVLSCSDQELLLSTIKSTVRLLKHPTEMITTEHIESIRELDEHFWRTNEESESSLMQKYHHHFSVETVILFVVLSIHDVLEEIERIHQHGQAHEKELVK